MEFTRSTLGFLAGTLGAAAIFVAVSSQNTATASNPTSKIGFTKKGQPYVKGEFLVKVRNRSALERFFAKKGSSLGLFSDRVPVQRTEGGDWYKVIASEGARAMQGAMESTDVLYMEPNYIYSINIGPGKPDTSKDGGPVYSDVPALPADPQVDPKIGDMYGLAKIKAQDAWKITRGSKRVTVADIDTGADYNHEDLINNIWRNPKEIPGNAIDDDNNGFVDDVVGWDFKDKDARPYDDNMHGSHTAGTIGATGSNGIGGSGVTQKVNLMILRFLGGSNGQGTTEDAILAIKYAADNNADIMSNSWGGDEFSQALEDAIRDAGKKGILFVAAAGNSSSDNDKKPAYPASHSLENVLTVASTTSSDSMSGFSNYGLKSVHLGAPGSSILSTVPNGGYRRLDGTSMACPHVAGAAALVKAAYPQLKAVELKELLMQSVDPTNAMNGRTVSGGRLNVAKALELARERYGVPDTTEDAE